MVKNNPNSAILIMNISGVCINDLNKQADRVSFVYGVDDIKNLVMFMEFIGNSPTPQNFIIPQILRVQRIRV